MSYVTLLFVFSYFHMYIVWLRCKHIRFITRKELVEANLECKVNMFKMSMIVLCVYIFLLISVHYEFKI